MERIVSPSSGKYADRIKYAVDKRVDLNATTPLLVESTAASIYMSLL